MRRRSNARTSAALCACVAVLAVAGEGGGQTPPDSVRVARPGVAADSVPSPPGADTLVSQEADTAVADSVFHNLPELEGELPEGWHTGVWVWDHSEILTSGANSLGELLSDVPGLLVLRAGDYGTPTAVTAFGVGAGGVRVVRDGFELFPVDGGIPDISRIGLAGIERVRVERSLNEVLIELRSRRHDDPRPYSLVEAGTGELETNVFRGTFVEPSALGGSVGLGLERTDTRGPGGNEPGNRTGTWLRYQLHRGDDLGVAFDLRRGGTESELEEFPSGARRSDWTVRVRARLAEGLTGELYTGKSSYRVDDERDAFAGEGGSRRQHGVRLAWSRTGLWARGAARVFGGGGLPDYRMSVQVGAFRPALGGVRAAWSRTGWGEDDHGTRGVRAWTAPLAGVVSFFGEYETGTYGGRLQPLLEAAPVPDSTDTPEDSTATESPEAPRLFAATERTARRLGARLTWRNAWISGALLRVEADTLLPLAVGPDRGGLLLPGGVHEGWEARLSLPTPLRGLRLEGFWQRWREPGPYLPEDIYSGALVFHRRYLETGNFEWWWTVGVVGRDPMTLPLPDPDAPAAEEGAPQPLVRVPFYQNWYARMQVRIVTVHIYVSWENFIRRPNLQHYPGRVLPIMRTVYGIRWTMFN